MWSPAARRTLLSTTRAMRGRRLAVASQNERIDLNCTMIHHPHRSNTGSSAYASRITVAYFYNKASDQTKSSSTKRVESAKESHRDNKSSPEPSSSSNWTLNQESWPDVEKLRASAQGLLSSKTKEATNMAKESVDSLSEKSKDLSASASSRATKVASSATGTTKHPLLERTKQWSLRLWNKTRPVITSMAQSTGHWLLHASQRGWTVVRGAAQTALQSAARRVQTTLTDAWRLWVMQPAVRLFQTGWKTVRQSIFKPLGQLQETVSPRNLWSKFVAWSLAAVAVYGIATTVPKEIVRHQLEQRNASTKNGNNDK